MMKFVDFEMPWERPYQFIYPSVTVEGWEEDAITFIIRCWVGAIDGYWHRVEMRFESVIEYRWYEFGSYYEDSDLPRSKYGFKPGEIINSAYVEHLFAKTVIHGVDGERLDGLKKEAIRHFRASFDDYGTFHIIALDYKIIIGDKLSGDAPEEQFKPKA